MLIDTHCHPQFPQYDTDRDEVIKRALDAGVQMICVGTDLEMSQKVIVIARRYKGVWASVGLHPNDVNSESRITNYESLANDPKVVAIGEVGLDYYRAKEPEKQKLQREVFEEFIDLAVKKNKPLIIHCRGAAPNFSDENLSGQAHQDMIEILQTTHPEKLRNGAGYSLQTVSGVIHSFTGTWQEAKQYIDLGFYIGLNGIITFTDQYNETVINVPLDRILLETDAPYLAPVPHRGKRNEPAHIKYVAEKIAELRKISLDEITLKTSQNARNLFKVSAAFLP